MYSKIIGSAVYGVDGTTVLVEADVSDGLPSFSLVGYLSSSVKEAGERVRTALKNSDFMIPPKRITINLAPAHMRKDGAGFDLPIALSILLCLDIPCVQNMEEMCVVGELGLDGSVKPVKGILSMVHYMYSEGKKQCMVPYENYHEASLIRGIKIIPVRNLRDAAAYISTGKLIAVPDIEYENKTQQNEDFSDIKGQESAKRGMEIAAAGFHNILLAGDAGAGKTMLARRLPGIMPELSFEEQLEVTKIYSVSGMLDENNLLMSRRPFRTPHHTITEKSLVGGGGNPKPGEVSLAHSGVLFLDELLEFKKSVLEVLRQPLEDKQIVVSRVNGKYVFPADFILCAAMNNCPCGHYPDISRCTCTPTQISRYRARLSGPLLDRIDICVNVRKVEFDSLFSDFEAEKSAEIRARVEAAREIQKKRYENENIHFNAQLDASLQKKYIRLGEKEENALKQVFEKKKLSARGTNKIIKLSRTLADLDKSTDIKLKHIEEACFYRNGADETQEVMGI